MDLESRIINRIMLHQLLRWIQVILLDFSRNILQRLRDTQPINTDQTRGLKHVVSVLEGSRVF